MPQEINITLPVKTKLESKTIRNALYASIAGGLGIIGPVIIANSTDVQDVIAALTPTAALPWAAPLARIILGILLAVTTKRAIDGRVSVGDITTGTGDGSLKKDSDK